MLPKDVRAQGFSARPKGNQIIDVVSKPKD
jgi:hypothetical protein